MGVTIDEDLKFDLHISEKVKTANNIMAVIRRSFTYLDKSIFTRLFKSLVRPHLEYASSVWYPMLQKSKEMIENVQRRATKRLACCKGLEYEDRLKKLDLPCLAYRKMRGDLIETYKMCTEKLDKEIIPPLTKASDIHERNTRGSTWHLHRTKAKKNIRSKAFRNRVVSPWNGLPKRVFAAPNVKCFERRLDRYWNRFNLKYSFENCLRFEKEHQHTTNPGNREEYEEDEDLESQVP